MGQKNGDIKLTLYPIWHYIRWHYNRYVLYLRLFADVLLHDRGALPLDATTGGGRERGPGGREPKLRLLPFEDLVVHGDLPVKADLDLEERVVVLGRRLQLGVPRLQTHYLGGQLLGTIV